MEQENKELTTTIKNAKKILVISVQKTQDEMLAGAGLALGLRNFGKEAFFADTLLLPPWEEFDWNNLSIENPGNENVIITINNNSNKIGEIHYEKTNEPFPRLRITIRQNSEKIKDTDVVVEKAAERPDVVILLGVQNKEELSALKEKFFSTLVGAHVVSLGHVPSKEKLANKEYIIENCSCIGEAVFRFLSNFLQKENPLGQKTKDVLLASIFKKITLMQHSSISASLLSTAAELITAGASTKRIQELLEDPFFIEQKNNEEKNGRFELMLKKAKIHNSNAFRWLTLNKEESSNLLPEEDFLLITQQLSNMTPFIENNIVIAQTNTGNPHPVFKGWLKSSKENVIKELSDLLNGFVFNEILTFPVRAQNTEEAERKIIRILESIFIQENKN